MESAAGLCASEEAAARRKVTQRKKYRGLPGREHLIGGLLAIAYDRMCAAFDSLCLPGWVWWPDWHRLVEG